MIIRLSTDHTVFTHTAHLHLPHLLRRSASPPSLLSFFLSVFSFLDLLLLNLLPKNKWIRQNATGQTNHPLINDFLVSFAPPWKKAGPLSPIYLPFHKKPSCTCFPRESRMPESPRVILNKGVWHITFLNVHFILGQVNEVFFKFISPAPKNW